MTSTTSSLATRLAAGLALGALVACGGGGGGGSTGTLALRATDAPFPATEGCLAAALVTVDGVTVQSEAGWRTIPLVDEDGDGQVTLDLLQLRSGIEASLAVGELPTGTYHQIRLHLVDATLQFTDGSPDRSFSVPSGMTSGLKVNVDGGFVIAAGQTTPLVLDFDLSKSFHTTGLGGDPTCDELKAGEGSVVFRPVVRAMVADLTGVVAGTVTDSGGLPVADVEVSAFAAGTVVDDSTEPVATTFSAPDGLENAPEGSYALRLDPGSYDLYVRAQGVETRTLAASSVVVSANAITTQDLTIP